MNGDFLEHYFTNNESLKSELRTIEYKYKDQTFIFNSDNGVFSKNKVDFGSRVLIETVLKENKRKVDTLLDVGCGYGFMGIVLAKILNAKPTLVDVNKRAVHLTKMNLKENKIDGETFVSDIYERVQNQFDLIITNPPIRAGKIVVLKILQEAKNHLKEEGELWFVIRKDQGAKSIIKELELEYKIEIVKKEKGFFIIKAKKVDIKNKRV